MVETLGDNLIIGSFLLKVTQWKNDFIKRPHSQYSKFENSLPKTESYAFVLVFVRETTQFLTAKHWLSWIPVTEKLRRTVLEKVSKELKETKIQIWEWGFFIKPFFYWATFRLCSKVELFCLIWGNMQYLLRKWSTHLTSFFHQFLNKVKDLEENSKKLDENLKTEHEKLFLIINNSKETHDKVLKVSNAVDFPRQFWK